MVAIPSSLLPKPVVKTVTKEFIAYMRFDNQRDNKLSAKHLLISLDDYHTISNNEYEFNTLIQINGSIIYYDKLSELPGLFYENDTRLFQPATEEYKISLYAQILIPIGAKIINKSNLNMTNQFIILSLCHGLIYDTMTEQSSELRNSSIKDQPDEFYFNHGLLHRTDNPPAESLAGSLAGPAVITKSIKQWVVNGKLHRSDDLPAVIDTSRNITIWYQHGLIHRDGNLPAYIDNDRLKKWYIKGQLHRSNDLPAYEDPDNNYYGWFQYGQLHRLNDLPAVIADERSEWYQYGKLHRDKGPALLYNNGDKAYYFQDMLHRTDGPAFEYASINDFTWVFYGKKHNLTGPAVINDLYRKWYILDQESNPSEVEQYKYYFYLYRQVIQALKY